MTATSATGGYLVPLPSPTPLEDAAFIDFMHAVIAGITGLANALVRPRWQREPPAMPAFDTTWLAFGVARIVRDTYAAVVHDSTSPGTDELRRHQVVELLVSVYGPQAEAVTGMLCDGLQIRQNRAAMTAAGIGLQETGETIRTADLVDAQWLPHLDTPLIVKRQIKRRYPVLNLLSAAIEILPSVGPATSFGVPPTGGPVVSESVVLYG